MIQKLAVQSADTVSSREGPYLPTVSHQARTGGHMSRVQKHEYGSCGSRMDIRFAANAACTAANSALNLGTMRSKNVRLLRRLGVQDSHVHNTVTGTACSPHTTDLELTSAEAPSRHTATLLRRRRRQRNARAGGRCTAHNTRRSVRLSQGSDHDCDAKADSYTAERLLRPCAWQVTISTGKRQPCTPLHPCKHFPTPGAGMILTPSRLPSSAVVT